MKSCVKSLIYDLLFLVAKNEFENTEEIERQINSGSLISYLKQKYLMKYLSIVDCSEVENLLRTKIGCFEYDEYETDNGLIHLIIFLLDF